MLRCFGHRADAVESLVENVKEKNIFLCSLTDNFAIRLVVYILVVFSYYLLNNFYSAAYKTNKEAAGDDC